MSVVVEKFPVSSVRAAGIELKKRGYQKIGKHWVEKNHFADIEKMPASGKVIVLICKSNYD
jgi:hypothetical protein